MEKTKMLPSHKTSEHTTKRQTYKARMFERLCKEEGAWASPKRSQSPKKQENKTCA